MVILKRVFYPSSLCVLVIFILINATVLSLGPLLSFFWNVVFNWKATQPPVHNLNLKCEAYPTFLGFCHLSTQQVLWVMVPDSQILEEVFEIAYLYIHLGVTKLWETGAFVV